jgi:hypothetical protein
LSNAHQAFKRTKRASAVARYRATALIDLAAVEYDDNIGIGLSMGPSDGGTTGIVGGFNDGVRRGNHVGPGWPMTSAMERE